MVLDEGVEQVKDRMTEIDHNNYNYLSIIVQLGSTLPPTPSNAVPVGQVGELPNTQLYRVDKSLGTQVLESVRSALESHNHVKSVELQFPHSRRVKRDEL
ncbi:hypothetical protein J056_003262 [Wallemia ichthyophaga EXF-994]|uniref:Uncharacterized protein n=1 Tax=Wallemia ichthyophaga (strain EXF-994 / CBS 113033) TaxID=1299270 RepID=R9AKS6_WALI9|nr:uncharacterized protein J056_003262 [Wallemia ichthyophaga EXF-994]EOR02700.1 hypothetical protein J056_003262 [Wallemia ichthyophaga EXF-994]